MEIDAQVADETGVAVWVGENRGQIEVNKCSRWIFVDCTQYVVGKEEGRRGT